MDIVGIWCSMYQIPMVASQRIYVIPQVMACKINAWCLKWVPLKQIRVSGFSWLFGKINKMFFIFQRHKPSGVNPAQFCRYRDTLLFIHGFYPKTYLKSVFSFLRCYPVKVSNEVNISFNWKTHAQTTLKCIFIIFWLIHVWRHLRTLAAYSNSNFSTYEPF